MNYQRHNWVKNEIIRARNLNHIEDGIFNNNKAIATLNGDSQEEGSVDYKIAHSPLGGHVIVDEEGVSFASRNKLQFNNATIEDDILNNTTIVTPSSGGSSFIAPTETSPATNAHDIGEHIIYDSQLYEVTTAIAIDDEIVVAPTVGYNVILSDTIEEQIEANQNSQVYIAGVESSSTASQSYLVGQYLIYNSLLYKVISVIAQGDTLTVGSNISSTRVADEISNHLSVGGTEFFFDSHDGEFGYNTSSTRGADTFHPFKGLPDEITMSWVVATTQNRTSSYTLPYTFKEGEWYIIAGTRASSTTLNILSGFTSYGNMYGNYSTSYSAYGNNIWFGQATSSTITVQVYENYTIILAGELVFG